MLAVWLNYACTFNRVFLSIERNGVQIFLMASYKCKWHRSIWSNYGCKIIKTSVKCKCLNYITFVLSLMYQRLLRPMFFSVSTVLLQFDSVVTNKSADNCYYVRVVPKLNDLISTLHFVTAWNDIMICSLLKKVRGQ